MSTTLFMQTFYAKRVSIKTLADSLDDYLITTKSMKPLRQTPNGCACYVSVKSDVVLVNYVSSEGALSFAKDSIGSAVINVSTLDELFLMNFFEKFTQLTRTNLIRVSVE